MNTSFIALVFPIPSWLIIRTLKIFGIKLQHLLKILDNLCTFQTKTSGEKHLSF